MRTPPLSLQTKLVIMLYSLLVTMLLILYRTHMMTMFATVVDPMGDMPAEDRSQLSSSSSFHRSNNVGQWDAVFVGPSPLQQQQRRRQQRCAINLYGLPRCFKHHVLPSFITNIVRVNRHYHCDYFVHYYNKTFESGGRSGQGGKIYPEDVLLLKPAIEDVHNNNSSLRHRRGQSPITVQFIADTDEDFEREQMEHLQTIFEYNTRGTRKHYCPYCKMTLTRPCSKKKCEELRNGKKLSAESDGSDAGDNDGHSDATSDDDLIVPPKPPVKSLLQVDVEQGKGSKKTIETFFAL